MIITARYPQIVSKPPLSARKFLFIITLAFIVVAGLLSGCATTYKVESDLVSAFKEPSINADKTGLYLIRGSNFVGGGRGIWVAINDKVVADLPNSSHVFLEFDNGINTLSLVQATAGFGYAALDNKPGEILYAKIDYTSFEKPLELINGDLGKSMVMRTTAVKHLANMRRNDAYDNLVINPGVTDYPIMIRASEEIIADANTAVVRFYRPGNLIANVAFDVWDQNGYIGSTKGGSYFSAKLPPGRHMFISRSERYSILDADLAAGKEYAVELSVGMGWNQAHIKLLPVDLNSESGNRQVADWKKSLQSVVVDKEMLAKDILAKRIETGFAFLESERSAIAKNEEPKRDLPANFGK